PNPFDPIRIMLRFSSMNSKRRAPSINSRSIFFGQFQSKSASGLNRPRRARVNLLFKLRAAFSASSDRVISSNSCREDHLCLVARASRSSSPSDVARSPICRSCPARSLLIVLVFEFVIDLQLLGWILQIVHVRMMEQTTQKNPACVIPVGYWKNKTNGARQRSFPIKAFPHSGVDSRRAEIIEHFNQSSGKPHSRFAALESRIEKLAD